MPSLKGFSLHRRGSSPRLGGSPRIAPSPTLPLRSKRNEQSIILESSTSTTTTTSSSAVPAAASATRSETLPASSASTTTKAVVTTSTGTRASSTFPASPIPERPVSTTPSHHLHAPTQYITSKGTAATTFTTAEPSSSSSTYAPFERPPSARSFSSSSYCGVPLNFLAACDTDTAYRTMCSIFPTASEQHIRHLFHK